MSFNRKFILFFLKSVFIFSCLGSIGFFFFIKTPHSKSPTPVHLRLKCKFISTISNRYLKYHINFNKEDEGFEDRMIGQFIKRLDPLKRDLIQADLTRIKSSMKGVLKKVRNSKDKDCKPILKAYEVYKGRVKNRVRFAKKFLNSNFKLNKNETLVLDPNFRDYPEDISKSNQYYKKYIQFQVASFVVGGEKTEKEAKEYISRQYERHLKNVDKKTRSELWALFLDSYSGALDPHSGYLSSDDLEEFEIRMSLSLEGIGANLSYRDGFTVVEELVSGGVASRSGLLKIKDKIIAVAEGEKGKFEHVIEVPLREVVKKIRGPKGTVVRLRILREVGINSNQEGGVQKFNISLIRDKIKLEEEAISYDIIKRKLKSDETRKIALVRLDSFYSDPKKGGRSAFSDFKELLSEIKKEKVDAMVLDLSLNRGGTLEDAVNIVGLFIKTGYVVKQSQRFPAPYVALSDRDPVVYYNGPLVVLVDRVSASASEIVAGALQDYKRAVVVGADHTFGKGSVQSVEILPKGFGAIKTTVGMFFIPGGKSTQRIGVSSDIILPSLFSADSGEKILDYALEPQEIKPFLSKSAYVEKGKSSWNKLDQNIIDRLKQKSQKRVQKSKDFQDILKTIRDSKDKEKVIKISDLFSQYDKKKNKDQEKKQNSSKKGVLKMKTGEKSPLEEKEDGKDSLSRKEKVKKSYLKRAAVNEAVSVALDLAEEFRGNLKVLVRSH